MGPGRNARETEPRALHKPSKGDDGFPVIRGEWVGTPVTVGAEHGDRGNHARRGGKLPRALHKPSRALPRSPLAGDRVKRQWHPALGEEYGAESRVPRTTREENRALTEC